MGFFNKNKNNEILPKTYIEKTNEEKQKSLQVLQLQDKLNHYNQHINKLQKDYNDLEKSVISFCQYILDRKFAESQLGGYSDIRNVDVFTLLEKTQNYYKERRLEERKMIITLTETLKRKDFDIENLKSQIYQLMMSQKNGMPITDLPSEDGTIPHRNNQQINNQVNPIMPSMSVQEPQQIKTVVGFNDDDEIEIPLKTVNNNQKKKDNIVNNKETIIQEKEKIVEKENKITNNNVPIKNDIVKPKIEVSNSTISNPQVINNEDRNNIIASINGENNINAHMIDLNMYIDKIDNPMWNVILAIGVDGLSVANDIKDIVQKRIEVTKSMVNTALMSLRSMGIIDDEKISVGYKWFYVYNLSPLGRKIFFDKFKKNPVKCEKEQLVSSHTTAVHGYCIKEVAELLKSKLKYETTTYDRKSNTLKLPEGRSYIPDVIARINNEIHYIEVELGHHTQKDFNDKCDKMLSVSKDLFFVVPSTPICDKILKQIAGWIDYRGGIESLKNMGIVVYVTTTHKLSLGKWEIIYNIN